MLFRVLGLRLGVVYAAGFAALAPLAASGQGLDEALVNAYANNPQLLGERAQLRATDEDVPQALANWRPTVSISGQYGDSKNNTKVNTPENGLPPVANTQSQLVPESYGLTVVQPLFRGGRTLAQTQEAVNLVRAERAHLSSVEQTVFLAVVTDYMNVVEEQAVVDLNLNNEQVLRRQLEATQDRFSVGEVTRTDVAQAEAAYAQAIAGRQGAQGQLQIFRAAFEHDVGTPPGKLVAPTAIPEMPTSRDEATSIAAVAAPTVISAEYSQEAAQDNVRLVQGQLLPTINLQGTIQRVHDSQFRGEAVDNRQIVAAASMPLYEGGAVYSQSRAAAQTVAQRKNQLDDARRAAVQAAAQAWEGLQSTRAAIVSFKEQIRSNEIALDGVQQEAQVGARTVLDILNQEQTLFQSRVSLVQSQHDEVIDEFSMAQALGRLDAKNLGLPVDYYDPDKNYETVRDKWVGFGTGQ